MSYEKSDFTLPTYEDSIGNTHGGQQLIDRLTNVRARHIREVIDGVVYPRIEEQAIYGIANTTIALIPSDVVADKPLSEVDFGDGKGEESLELVGFPSDDIVQQVRLNGHLNRTQFWRQAGVLEEFQRVLQGKLAAAPFAPVPQQLTSQSPPSSSELEESATARRRGLLRRRQGIASTPSSTLGLERATTETMAEKPASGLRARVVLEEICFRTVSDFGLYETISRPAVMVYVVARL